MPYAIKNSMIVSDNTIEAECLSDFFKNLGESSVKVGKNLAKNVLKNPSRALDITANLATAAASRTSKNVMKTLPEVINLHRTRSGLYFGKIV